MKHHTDNAGAPTDTITPHEAEVRRLTGAGDHDGVRDLVRRHRDATVKAALAARDIAGRYAAADIPTVLQADGLDPHTAAAGAKLAHEAFTPSPNTHAAPFQTGDNYDIARKEYLVISTEGHYIPYTESQYKRILKSRDVSGSVPKGEQLSEIDLVILETQDRRSVVYSGSLAGWRAGVQTTDTGRILVTNAPNIIKPVPGPFRNLSAFLESLFANDHNQLISFCGWVKIAVSALHSHRFRPGQAMAICGVKDCGKSLCQSLITHILGGRFARPYMYMVGRTDFNSDLFTAEHLMIEDDVPSSTIADRRAFGAKIKEITANQGQRLHAKGRDAIMLPVFWRISITVNDEPENLMILPPLDESLKDKIVILRADPAIIPCETASDEGRAECWKILTSEVPAFLAWLEQWDIPIAWRSGRYGVREYHHPEIMQTLEELSPESRLAQIIDRTLFDSLMPSEWTGTSTALEQLLTTDSGVGYEARRVLSFNTACGVYLSRLRNKEPERYSMARHANSNEWTIKPPLDFKNPSTPSTEGGVVEGVEGFFNFYTKAKDKKESKGARARVENSKNPSTPSTPSTDENLPF